MNSTRENILSTKWMPFKKSQSKVLYVVLISFTLGAVFQSVDGQKSRQVLDGHDNKSILKKSVVPVNSNLSVVPRTFASVKKLAKSIRKRNRKAKGRKSRNRPQGEQKRINKQEKVLFHSISN